jgi:hypothetical protein
MTLFCSKVSDMDSFRKTSEIFLLRKVPERKEWPKIRSERGGVNTPMPENEVPERRSGAFRHKNTPG